MREAVLLFDQSQFPRGDGTAHDPNLQHSCGSRRCQKLFVLLKDFQMMTWPALWMVATAQTRRRVSGDLRTVFSLAVIARGNPQLLERALCRALLTSLAGAKRDSHRAKGKVLGLCGHACCQPLEMLGFDSVEALQLQLPPGQMGPVSPLSPRGHMHGYMLSFAFHHTTTNICNKGEIQQQSDKLFTRIHSIKY